jgi:hypothetical protein
MELAKQIDVAPKNGDFIVLQDAGSWELGRWAQETNGWVQPDGSPVRISPTHWTADRERLLFLAPSLRDGEIEQTPKRPLIRLILAFVTTIFFIGGYVFWIGSEHSSSDNSAADLEREFSQERSRAFAVVGGLTAARERENVAPIEALEAKQITDARQKELKQALDESETKSEALARELVSVRENDIAARNLAAARERENAAKALEAKKITDARQKELKQALDKSETESEALARELVSVRKNDVAARNLAAARERENAAKALEAKKITDSRQKELKQALDESEKRAFALERELASARKTIASAEKSSNAEVTARDAAAPTGQGSNAASEITASITTPQSGGSATAGVQVSSGTAPADATARASGRLTRSNQFQPGRPQPPSAMSSAEEARHVARAKSMIKQFNFAGARLLLAYALDKGSARAAFMLAETYDGKILRSLRAYDVRGDAAMAREFYLLAAEAGIEKARERVEAIQSDENVDTHVAGEKRGR